MLPNSCVEIFKSTPGWTQSTCMCATLRWTQLWTRTPPVLKAAPYMWLSSRAMSAPRWSFRLWQLTRRLYLRLAQGKRFAALRYQELSVIDGPSPTSTSQSFTVSLQSWIHIRVLLSEFLQSCSFILRWLAGYLATKLTLLNFNWLILVRPSTSFFLIKLSD